MGNVCCGCAPQHKTEGQSKSDEDLNEERAAGSFSRESIARESGNRNTQSLAFQENVKHETYRESTSLFRSLPEKLKSASETSSINMKRFSYNEAKANELFAKYADPRDSLIRPEGVSQLCDDLQLEADDLRVLVLAWKCGASQMCQFTKKEFMEGLSSLHCDSVTSLQSCLQELSSQMVQSSEEFSTLYKWSFSFALETKSQRGLSLEIASQLWKVVFSQNAPEILDFWLDFLAIHSDSITYITRDTWYLFLIFVRRCAHDLSTYDETEAWPSLFDDFVQFHNDQTNQNCAKSPWDDGTGDGNLISSP